MECPECQGTEFVFDWEGIVSVKFREGETIESVVYSGVLGSLPDRFVCYECGHEIDLKYDNPIDPDEIATHRAMGNAASDLVTDQLPWWLTNELSDGKEVYKA